MANRECVKPKNLREACWKAGLTIAALCRELGISRQTAYDAWANPSLFPIAAPKLFKRLNGKIQ